MDQFHSNFEESALNHRFLDIATFHFGYNAQTLRNLEAFMN